MLDGPQSVQQTGHWLSFEQEASLKVEYSLDDNVKMYFYNQMVSMGAFITS